MNERTRSRITEEATKREFVARKKNIIAMTKTMLFSSWVVESLKMWIKNKFSLGEFGSSAENWKSNSIEKRKATTRTRYLMMHRPTAHSPFTSSSNQLVSANCGYKHGSECAERRKQSSRAAMLRIREREWKRIRTNEILTSLIRCEVTWIIDFYRFSMKK